MKLTDWAILAAVAGYCLYLLLRRKSSGCCGDCSRCSGCRQEKVE